jgi:hypothetical protein
VTDDERSKARSVQVRLAFALICAILANVLTLGMSVGYAAVTNGRTERKFCDVIGTQDSTEPITTPRGVQVAVKWRTLAHSLGCPEPRSPVTTPSGGRKK